MSFKLSKIYNSTPYYQQNKAITSTVPIDQTVKDTSDIYKLIENLEKEEKKEINNSLYFTISKTISNKENNLLNFVFENREIKSIVIYLEKQISCTFYLKYNNEILDQTTIQNDKIKTWENIKNLPTALSILTISAVSSEENKESDVFSVEINF